MTKLKKEPARTQTYSIRGQVIGGMVLASLLVAGIMGWAARAKLEGAVVVMGEVAVERDLRVVQHRDGGIVGEILVGAGDMVQRGDVLLRLDDTSARTEKAIIHGKIAEFSIRKARLEAERDLQAQFRMPDNVASLEIGKEKLNAILAGERAFSKAIWPPISAARNSCSLAFTRSGSKFRALRRASTQRKTKFVWCRMRTTASWTCPTSN